MWYFVVITGLTHRRPVFGRNKNSGRYSGSIPIPAGIPAADEPEFEPVLFLIFHN
jgi:hypothetical protein